jgi:hypothetical protein
MSSMLSKNHIKAADLQPYLRGYDNRSPETAEEWAKVQSSGFVPGMLIFCLEKVASAPGLAVGRRDEAVDSFKVRDLCIVVGEDGDRPLVVNITASAYELRFLEVLMFEKAKKAILDEKEFPFVAAKPLTPLDQTRREEIEQLGAVYAQGGSRRSLQLDVTGPQEPAMALLNSLGVKLTLTGIGKQNIDIGYVCLLLFSPDGRTEDKNRAQVKSAFVPMLASEGPGAAPQAAAGGGATAARPQQAAPAQAAAGSVWQDPLPPGEVRVPPGSENLLSSSQSAIQINEAPDATPAWQPPTANVPDFSFSPSQPAAFGAGTNFQEELAHKTEFEEHLGQGAQNANWSNPGQESGWAAPVATPTADWGAPAANQPADWAPAPTDPSWAGSADNSWSTPPAPPSTAPIPPTGGQGWPNQAAPLAPQPPKPPSQPAQPGWSTAPAPTASDWSTPPTAEPKPAQIWNPPTAGGDWGLPPADAGKNEWSERPPVQQGGGDWGTPPAPMPPAGGGDWGRPALASFQNPEPEPRSQSDSGSWNTAAVAGGPIPGSGAWNTPWAQSPQPEPAKAEAASEEAPPEEPASEGAHLAKKDANLFNRLYQQLAKGSPSSSMTGMAAMVPNAPQAAGPNPNASQSNLPKLSQELLSRTSAPQSPNASATNLQPMDPELAAHFRIPVPPPGADANAIVQTGNQTPIVVAHGEAPAPEPIAPPVAKPPVSPAAEDVVSAEISSEVAEGNAAPSWIESLDKRKSAPYATSSNLKPPTVTPAPTGKKPSASSTNLQAFEMPADFNLPADPDLLRETGKIKMTPSMRDQVKKKSGMEISKPEPVKMEELPAAAEAAVEVEAEDTVYDITDATNAPPPVFAEMVSDEPALAEMTASTPAAADALPLPQEMPKLSKEEDPYKHLAEALSGLMNFDDDGPETAESAQSVVPEPVEVPVAQTAPQDIEPEVAEPEAKQADSVEPRAADNEDKAESPVAEAAEAPSAVTAPVETMAEEQVESPKKAESINKPSISTTSVAGLASGDNIPTLAPSQGVSSRFAAMQAALSTSEDSPFKSLGIDKSQPVQAPDVEVAEGTEGSPLRETNFLVTSKTDIPAILDIPEAEAESDSDAAAAQKPSPADALTANSLISSAPDLPSLPKALAQEAAEAEEAQAKQAAAVAAARPIQEPRLVMNEMVTLMNKLEQQVGKAAKKISSRAEEIKQRLNKQVDELIANASQVETQNQVAVQESSVRLSKSLDASTDEGRQNIIDKAAAGRAAIKQLLTANQMAVDETKNRLLEDLRKAGDDFRKESESLAQDCEVFLATFVKEKTDLIGTTLNETCGRIEETSDSFQTKINSRFERFKERMNDEASSIGRSLERNVHSMFEEIDGSWDRASEKLKLTKSEFEQTILHSVKTVELSVSQNTRQILISSMAPQLRERTRRLLDIKDTLTKQFMSDTVAQSSLQLQGLESSLAAARQQLHTLVADCVSNLDGVGRGQQAGLEEIFKTASAKTEKLTSEVQLAIQDAQTRIQENEVLCKRLAETSNVDTDPELTDERNATTQGVQKVKSQCNSQIQVALEDACSRLEHMSQKVQNEAANHRMQHTQQARDASENGLNRIREALQEAFAAVQTAREQYME